MQRERKQRSKKKKKKKKKNVSTMASYLSETGRCRPRSEDVAVVVVVVVVGTYDDSMMSFWSSQNAAFCGIPISQLRCCSRAMMMTTIPKGMREDSKKKVLCETLFFWATSASSSSRSF